MQKKKKLVWTQSLVITVLTQQPPAVQHTRKGPEGSGALFLNKWPFTADGR